MGLSGSSPRTRGTAWAYGNSQNRTRFIPADAGNRAAQTHDTDSRAVHPRGRGEQQTRASILSGDFGSSPRTRGTVFGIVTAIRQLRFIPADAGNRRSMPGAVRNPTVHPRGRGEQPTLAMYNGFLDGSSPRTRGTVVLSCILPDDRRFIPADAGNRSTRQLTISRPPVHPRGRGEQVCEWAPRPVAIGSSPRTRGTVLCLDIKYEPYRFIPADAGNRRSPGLIRRPPPVHPRGRGEQLPPWKQIVFVLGSSPRTRGTGDFHCSIR